MFTPHKKNLSLLLFTKIKNIIILHLLVVFYENVSVSFTS
jgi:hypothetical protein